MARFVLQRTLRITASVVVLLLLTAFLLGDEPRTLLVAALMGLVLWAPTSAVLFRITFLPGPADPRLRGDDGRPLSALDAVHGLRANAAEHLLGSLPLLIAGLFAAFRLGPLGIAAGTLAVAIVTASGANAVYTMEHQVSRVEAATGRSHLAAQRLTRLVGWSWGRRRDALLHSLARVRFGEGRVDDALSALARIRDPERFFVVPLRAQMLAGRDPDRALRALAHPGLSEGQRALIEALVDLHTDRVELVRQRSAQLGDIADGSAHDVRSLLHLLLAAALAPDEGAVEHLVAGGWARDRLPWLHQVWPAVARRLEAIAHWPEVG